MAQRSPSDPPRWKQQQTEEDYSPPKRPARQRSTAGKVPVSEVSTLMVDETCSVLTSSAHELLNLEVGIEEDRWSEGGGLCKPGALTRPMRKVSESVYSQTTNVTQCADAQPRSRRLNHASESTFGS